MCSNVFFFYTTGPPDTYRFVLGIRSCAYMRVHTRHLATFQCDWRCALSYNLATTRKAVGKTAAACRSNERRRGRVSTTRTGPVNHERILTMCTKREPPGRGSTSRLRNTDRRFTSVPPNSRSSNILTTCPRRLRNKCALKFSA